MDCSEWITRAGVDRSDGGTHYVSFAGSGRLFFHESQSCGVVYCDNRRRNAPVFLILNVADIFAYAAQRCAILTEHFMSIALWKK
jgi:hypothetical protein